MEQRFDILEKKVDRILLIIENDKAIGKVGVAEQVALNLKDISQIKTDKKVFWGKVGVISFFLGSFGGFISYLFKLIFLK